MLGNQHKRMGMAAGVGILTYTILSKSSPELALFMVSTPLGAMLPDIDHDRSKIGQTRKNIFGLIKLISFLSLVLFVLYSFYTGGILSALLNFFYVGGVVLAISIIERNKHIKKQLGFITKHRGIMHTMIPTAFLIGTTLWIENAYINNLVYGLALGTVIHLLGDMATVEGAPIMWPITKVNFRYFAFNTAKNSMLIELVCNVWCLIFVLLGIYFGMR